MNDLILLIRTSRPASWAVGWLLFLTGFYVSGAAFSLQALINMQILILLSLIVFGINDVYDYETDRRNKRKNSFIEGYVLPKESHAFVKKVSAASAAVLVIFSIGTNNITNILATVLAVLFAYAYSAPPLRLKERPVIDSLSNAAAVLILLLIGFSYGGTLLQFPAKLIYASLGAAAIHAVLALADYAADKNAGITTIATFFGKRFAALFAAAIILAIILFSGIKSTVLNVYLWLVLAVSLVSFVIPDEKLVRKLAGIMFYAFLAALSLFIYQQFFK